MIGLLQRVSEAHVVVADRTIASIGPGLLVFVGVERDDSRAEAARLAERVLAYRIFPDREGRMNCSVKELEGDILAVPQFTLAADTQKGNRPGFSTAAPPDVGRALFEYFVNVCARAYGRIATGEFGADMRVALVNDGPATFWLQVSAPRSTANDRISV
jgi:D-tyrosyl-tRNA(Tyr) deacylase